MVEFDNGIQKEDYDAIVASGKNPLRTYVTASNYNNGMSGGEMSYYAVRDDIIASPDTYVVGIITYSSIEAALERANGREVEKEIIVTGEWITAESIQ